MPRCYLCDKEVDKLYPVNHCIKTVCMQIYVCKDCVTNVTNINKDRD